MFDLLCHYHGQPQNSPSSGGVGLLGVYRRQHLDVSLSGIRRKPSIKVSATSLDRPLIKMLNDIALRDTGTLNERQIQDSQFPKHIWFDNY
jgi:hypothetical protein